jgi:hypothetical protein
MPAAKSQRELARQIGVSQPSVAKLVKHADWPVRRKAPWRSSDVDIIKRWRKSLNGNHDDSMTTLSSAKKKVDIMLASERMKNERIKREITEGQYVRRELMDGALGGMAAVFVGLLDELVATCPERMAGKSAGQIKKEFTILIDHSRNRLVEKGEYELLKLNELVAQLAHSHRGRPTIGSK